MKRRIILWLAIGLAITMFVSSCAPKKQAPAKKEKLQEIKVAYTGVSLEYNLLLDMAEKKGYFKENGIKIKRMPIETEPLPLLLSNQADVSFQLIGSSVTAFLNNQNVKWIATISNYPASFNCMSRLPKEEIGAVKKVGVSKLGSAYHISIIPVLKKLGADVNKVQFIPLGKDESRVAALSKGEIDLTFADMSFAQPGFYVIRSAEAFKGIYAPIAIITTQKALDEKSEAVKAFVKAIYESLQYCRSNKDEVVSYLESKHNLSKKQAEAFYKAMRASKVNLKFVPEKSVILDIVDATRSVAKPANPGRDLKEFIYKDFAKKAAKK